MNQVIVAIGGSIEGTSNGPSGANLAAQLTPSLEREPLLHAVAASEVGSAPVRVLASEQPPPEQHR